MCITEEKNESINYSLWINDRVLNICLWKTYQNLAVF